MHIGCQPTVKLDCQGGKKKAPFLLLLLAPRGARLQFANVLSGSRGLTVNDLPQKEPAGRGARRTRANPAARTHWPSRAATGSTGTASRLPGPGTSRGSGRRRPRGSHGGHLAGGIDLPQARPLSRWSIWGPVEFSSSYFFLQRAGARTGTHLRMAGWRFRAWALKVGATSIGSCFLTPCCVTWSLWPHLSEPQLLHV